MLHVRRSSRKRKSTSVCEPSQAAAARRTTTTATVPVRSQAPRIAPATAAPQDHDTHTPVSQGPVFVSLGAGCSSQLPPSVSTPGNATMFQLSPSSIHMDTCQIAPSVSHITSNSLPQLTTFSTGVAPQPIMSINKVVSSTVPKNIKDNIINGEFIDLATLLSNDQNTNSQKLVIIKGEIAVQQSSNTNLKIQTIDQWTNVFIICTSIFCSVHTLRLQELLKYMFVIRQGDSRCSNLGWKTYDE